MQRGPRVGWADVDELVVVVAVERLVALVPKLVEPIGREELGCPVS